MHNSIVILPHDKGIVKEITSVKSKINPIKIKFIFFENAAFFVDKIQFMLYSN